jgi:hypothetical protein
MQAGRVSFAQQDSDVMAYLSSSPNDPALFDYETVKELGKELTFLRVRLCSELSSPFTYFNL